MASSVEDALEKTTLRRKQVMLGQLPEDFLSVGSDIPTPLINQTKEQQISSDWQAAHHLQARYTNLAATAVQQTTARLNVTIIEAKLNKSYSVIKMDPYLRLRVGHAIFETETDSSGGKNPHWNKTIFAGIPKGVDSIFVEVFDEKAFMMDERIAWTHIPIPQEVSDGNTLDKWYLLSGKLGEDLEGSVHIILSYVESYQNPTVIYPNTQVMMVPGLPVVSSHTVTAPSLPMQQIQNAGQPIPPLSVPSHVTDDDVKQVNDMFPNVDGEVIRSLLEVNRNNKDLTINNLLAMDSIS